MAWKDNLRPASFRGTPFKVEGHRTDAGARRVALHQYPGRDVPLAEDMGRKAQEIAIDGYVLGADYMAARDALIDACGKKGAADLVHPYLGQMQVMCTGCTVEERSAEGGMARFQLTFVQAGESRFPSASTDTSSIVTKRAALAETATANSFASSFSVDGMPGFVADRNRSLLNDLAGAIGGAASAMGGAAGSFFSLTTLDLSDPVGVATKVIGAVKMLAGINAMAPTLPGFEELANFGAVLPATPLTTPSRLQEFANNQATADLVRRSASIVQASAAPSIPFFSNQETIGFRDTVSDRLDMIMHEASDRKDSDVFSTVSDLRSAVVTDLTSRAPSRASLISVATRITEPALVAAYRLYGDASRAEELAARNDIRHPGFMPGGEIMEAVSDA